MSIKKIIFFHYHYLRGGISSVTSSLISTLPEGIKTAAAADPGMGFQGLGDTRIKKILLPACGYTDPDDFSEETFQSVYSDLMKAMDKLADPETLFWVHNHAIGKNPAFTAAVTAHAKRGVNPMLLHIHDFAECGRLNNYNFLKKHLNEFYPLGENIHYAAINSRDFGILRQSGVPSEALYYLPNIYTGSTTLMDKDAACEMLKEQCAEGGYHLDTGKPVFVYPVRTIRRKNVLEAYLIARLSNANIIVTLPANSKPERKYESIAARCARSADFRGSWALGTRYPEHWRCAFSAADLILSTSVMEGFGMLFAEAAAMGKNTLARRIHVLDDFPASDNISIYNEFSIPLDNIQHKRIIDYYKKITAESIDDPVFRSDIMERLSRKCSVDACEFSYADPRTQEEAYTRSSLHDEIRRLNAPLFEGLNNAMGTRPPPMDLFSPEQAAPLLRKIVDNTAGAIQCSPGFADGSSIRKAFMRPEYYRILLTRSGGYR